MSAEIIGVRHIGFGRRIAGRPPIEPGARIKRDDSAPTLADTAAGYMVAPLSEIEKWLEDWPNEWVIEWAKPADAEPEAPAKESLRAAKPYKPRRGADAAGAGPADQV
jgi:hypothetical protein